MGLNWLTMEWKLLAEEFWTVEKKDFKGLKPRKGHLGFKQQKAKKKDYGQAALSLEFWSFKLLQYGWSCKSTAIR